MLLHDVAFPDPRLFRCRCQVILTTVIVTCPTCGKQSKTPDDARGKRGRCGGCKTSFVLEPSGPPPVCASCGLGLEKVSRYKNAHGETVCESCWQQAAKMRADNEAEARALGGHEQVVKTGNFHCAADRRLFRFEPHPDQDEALKAYLLDPEDASRTVGILTIVFMPHTEMAFDRLVEHALRRERERADEYGEKGGGFRFKTHLPTQEMLLDVGDGKVMVATKGGFDAQRMGHESLIRSRLILIQSGDVLILCRFTVDEPHLRTFELRVDRVLDTLRVVEVPDFTSRQGDGDAEENENDGTYGLADEPHGRAGRSGSLGSLPDQIAKAVADEYLRMSEVCASAILEDLPRRGELTAHRVFEQRVFLLIVTMTALGDAQNGAQAIAEVLGKVMHLGVADDASLLDGLFRERRDHYKQYIELGQREVQGHRESINEVEFYLTSGTLAVASLCVAEGRSGTPHQIDMKRLNRALRRYDKAAERISTKLRGWSWIWLMFVVQVCEAAEHLGGWHRLRGKTVHDLFRKAAEDVISSMPE